MKRYDCETDHWAGIMVEYEDGEYIKYDDYLKENRMANDETPAEDVSVSPIEAQPEHVAAVQDAIAAAEAANEKKLELVPCPCGSVPATLMIQCPERGKYGSVTGDCCGEWTLEFKNGYEADKQQTLNKAVKAWNGAPRAA